MSLINQMLSDLEARRGGVPVAGQMVLDGLSPADMPAGSRPGPAARLSWLLLSLLVAVVTLMLVRDDLHVVVNRTMAAFDGNTAHAAISVPSASAPALVEPVKAASLPAASPALLRADVQAALTTLPAPAVKPAPIAASFSEISEIGVAKEDDGAALRIRMSAPVRYALQVDAQGLVRLELYDVRLRDGYTQRFDATDLIHDITLRANPETGELVTFRLADSAHYTGAGIAAAGDDYVLVVHCRESEPVPAAAAVVKSGAVATLRAAVSKPKPVRMAGTSPVPIAQAQKTTVHAAEQDVIRKTIPSTAKGDPAAQLYAEAMTAFQAGARGRAEAMAKDVLSMDPQSVPARVLAATIQFEDHRLGAARRTLEAGLALTPDNSRLNLVYGRVLAEQGDVSGAIERLTRAAPPAAADPQYHALIAALLQRAGRHDQAITAYRQILALEPRNGIWWIGLAISLAASGQTGDAVNAYHQALVDAALSANLRHYVDAQLSRLQKTRG